jgi:hypothetical protein
MLQLALCVMETLVQPAEQLIQMCLKTMACNGVFKERLLFRDLLYFQNRIHPFQVFNKLFRSKSVEGKSSLFTEQTEFAFCGN